ncbi:tyrosine-type recombinase/integrase [Streptomyces sp. H39-S7]|uniref:tyrosine-type recombinase/integrase n=1 Tax=Streptomyces sp. H39-S7 TaxID=3004357 RepID=UPI0022B03F3D|nr:tyrosine-type recombinase/integrase [Streptomyces sp. H39-S7]MCZ4122618.1 tyrosine-type recombinase/integrase [Streptomyces sp. H39-S7]
MAGHIQDRWFKTETDVKGKTTRVKSERHGSGLRYRARYVGPDGTEKSKSFPDGQKRLADKWLAQIEADMARGQYIDPKAGRTTFQQYAERWVAAQTTDVSTRAGTESRLRLHAYPHMGSRPLGSFQPEHIREWSRHLEDKGLAASYRRVIFANVSAVFTAATDDGLIGKNPCRASSVKAPAMVPSRVRPWTAERVFAVRAALPAQYRAMADAGGGCGLRQGEIFGLPVDEVGFLTGWVHVAYQVKLVDGQAVFAPPKRGKVRDVPLPERVGQAFAAHMKQFPPVDVTLPWLAPGGRPVTKKLMFTAPDGGALLRNNFNVQAWKPALVAAGVLPEPEPGQRIAESREDGMHALRHFYASVLLDGGENVKALSSYLGHSDAGFTLRVYTHLMPSSESRTRKAVDGMYRAAGEGNDGPQAAQAA